MIELLFDLALPANLLLAGYGFGRWNEGRHYASIRRREQDNLDVVALTTRFPPEGVEIAAAELVSGGMVVSSDYFKSFVAGFRTLVGGRFRGYESLLDRARREALLRLKEAARARGAHLVIGVRFHSTRVAGTRIPAVEVIAYGTAIGVR